MTKKAITSMLHNNTPIHSATFVRNIEEGYIVGKEGVTDIRVYGEPGNGAYIPYIAIYIDGQDRVRVPASECIIVYKEEEAE